MYLIVIFPALHPNEFNPKGVPRALIHCNVAFYVTYIFCCIDCFKAKKISVSSSKAEVFLGIRLVFEPNDYHCSKRVHFTAEYVFFSGFGLLLSFILVDNEGERGKKKKLSSAGNEFFFNIER